MLLYIACAKLDFEILSIYNRGHKYHVHCAYLRDIATYISLRY